MYKSNLSVTAIDLDPIAKEGRKSNFSIIKGLSRTGHPQIQPIREEERLNQTDSFKRHPLDSTD